jgi:predicted acyl esterase
MDSAVVGYLLDADSSRIGEANPVVGRSVTYEALSDGVSFLTAPFERETEITGPVKVRLWVSSSTEDMDVFATLRAFDLRGNEVTFEGASEPRIPISQGWLRVSHRKTDPALSTENRPYHTHDVEEKLRPGEAVPIDVEIWPTCMVYPAGYRLGLTLQGKDFERPGEPGDLRGSGPFLHNDPDDRRPAVFGEKNTIHTGGARESYLLLPVIPSPEGLALA